MLRALRKRIQLIRYYSARRSETVWSHALRLALLASLLLGPFTMLITELLWTRQQTMHEVEGGIVRLQEGQYLAVVIRDDAQRMPWTQGTPYGEFRLRRTATAQGFPFVTRMVIHSPRLYLRRFSGGAERRVRLDGEPALRAALESALAEANEPAMLAGWQSPARHEEVRRLWLNSFTSAAAWWVSLSFLAWIAIPMLRFCTLVMTEHRQRRVERRALSGLCATCGYNLKGLEFHARCPECGSLIE